MSEIYLNYLFNFLKQNYVQIIISLLALLLGYLLKYFKNKFLAFWDSIFRKRYRYLFGEYFGYFFMRDDKTIIHMNLKIKPRKFRKIHIILKEMNTAGYEYKGKVQIEGDILFAYLQGQQQDDFALLVCMIPFNHRNEMTAMNGILSGISQDKKPSATKIVFSRFPLSEHDVKLEFEENSRRITVQDIPYVMRKMEMKNLEQ